MDSEFRIIVFKNDDQTEPFTEWLLALDAMIRKRILVRIARIQAGNFGDCKQIDNNLFELRCFFGSGYRIYFSKDERNTVVLLYGGDKNSQTKDIRQAKQYWSKYYEQKSKKSK